METQQPLRQGTTPRRADRAAGQSAPPKGLSRRGVLGQAGRAVAATATAGTLATLPWGAATRAADGAPASSPPTSRARADRAYAIRVRCARAQRARPLPAHPTNGDETRYATTRIGNYSKGLPHNALGTVDPAAYAALLAAVQSGRPAAFEAISLGGTAKLADPQASFAFLLEGADSACLAADAPPAFSSAQEAAEMAELYWQALARDVHFARYATDPLIARAAADLSRLSDFRGPKTGGEPRLSAESAPAVDPLERTRAGGTVTPATIFRSGVAGEMTGPYVSQFLWLPVAYGALPMAQRYPVAPPQDFMTTFDAWLDVQQGRSSPPRPASAASRPSPTRYVSAGRDLTTYLHTDFPYQAYENAALLLTTMGAPLDANSPYRHSKTQAGFATFGPPHLLDLVAKVANAALKACWYQKWVIHRRLRPEEFGGRVHLHKTGAASYPLHGDLLTTSAVLDAVWQTHGSYLLPMAYAEGSPMHPAYPAGHMAIAGACVTVLKAYFDEAFVLPRPVVASADGRALLPYSGPALTVGGELNKLAGNVAMGRDFSGVHWRTDGLAGLRLGEAVSLGILADERSGFNETFKGFTLTTFDGTTITV